MAGAAGDALSVSAGRVEAVHRGRLTWEASGESVVLQSGSAEYQSGVRFLPREGEEDFDLRGGRYLAVDLESLAEGHQQRLCLRVADAHGDTYAGIALDPGEKATLKLHLPHAAVYASPVGAKGVRTLDTEHITRISLEVMWPHEGQFAKLLHCRISNLRLMGAPDVSRRVEAAEYCPFVDAFGQFAHGTWKGKVTSADELRADLARERRTLQKAPGAWDDVGGWAQGPQLEATGRFRTAKVGGRWWLVTPSGHLFYSLGINVIKLDSDAPNGLLHPEWYCTPAQRAMSFPTWNLQAKFWVQDVRAPYYEFLLQRLDAWGINTIGNWADGELTRLGRKPYVMAWMAKPAGVPMLPNGFYDTLDPAFEDAFKAAGRAAMVPGSALAVAATDPMCIGFFIDNELSFPTDSAYYEPYFRVCREVLAEGAPGKLYLGCRFKGFRASEALWRAAAKYCDVISVNSYVNSVATVMEGEYAVPRVDCPILHTEFHFGTLHRGMFSAGLCPVGDQCDRARAFTRVVEGALRHPNFVGSHWFQYRDQPLVGRGDGEAYQIGFVDVCDRPYGPLTKAARAVGESMYQIRSNP